MQPRWPLRVTTQRKRRRSAIGLVAGLLLAICGLAGAAPPLIKVGPGFGG